MLGRVAESTGVGALRSTPDIILDLTMEAMVGPELYSNQGFMQFMHRRNIGWSDVDHDRDAFLLPSFESQMALLTQQRREMERVMERMAAARYWAQRDRERREMEAMAEWQRRRLLTNTVAETRVGVPSRPVPSQSGEVVFPPSTSFNLSRFFSRQVIETGVNLFFAGITRGRFKK